jgi:hypothetical protein
MKDLDFNINEYQNLIFTAGGQYILDYNFSKTFPKSYYENLIDIHSKYSWAPWCFERIRHIIFQNKTKNNIKFTFVYIDYNSEVYEKYLLNSLKNIKASDFNIVGCVKVGSISETYNRILKSIKNENSADYIIFTHGDVSYSRNFLKDLENTIRKNNKKTIYGFVGKQTDGNVKWSNIENSLEMQVFDSCCIVVPINVEFMFDSINFDEYHLYVEDFCYQAKFLWNYSLMLIQTSADERSNELHKSGIFSDFTQHHSSTCNNHGFEWGNYKEYLKTFNEKWNNITNNIITM